METQGRAGIEKTIEVMHAMEAPEEGPFVIPAMPPVDQEIEQQQIEGEARAPLPPARPPGDGMAGGKGRERQDNERGEREIDGGEAGVAP